MSVERARLTFFVFRAWETNTGIKDERGSVETILIGVSASAQWERAKNVSAVKKRRNKCHVTVLMDSIFGFDFLQEVTNLISPIKSKQLQVTFAFRVKLICLMP